MGSGGSGLYSPEEMAGNAALDVARAAAAAAAASASAAAAAAGTVSYIVGTGTAVVNAGAAGVATSLAPVAGIGPLGWVVIGVAIVGSFLLRGKKKRPPPEAQGIRLSQPTDPNAPWIKVYGQPWFAPPLLSEWALPAKMNSAASGQSAARASLNPTQGKLLHCGGGPVSGADLRLRIGGRTLFGTVDTDSPASTRGLTARDTSRKAWGIPAKFVVPESVAIYFDGVQVWTGENGGHATDATPAETVGPSVCAAETFSRLGFWSKSNRDSDIPAFEARVGCRLPKDGPVDERSVKATVLFDGAQTYKLPGSGRAGRASSVDLVASDFAFGQTDDAKRYFWAQVDVVNRLRSGLASQGIVKGFRLTYETPSHSTEAVVSVDEHGNGTVTFAQAVPSTVAAVTATYKTDAPAGEGFRFHLWTGQATQKAVGDGGAEFFGAPGAETRKTVAVGDELVRDVPVTYSTADEVDDVVLVLESGTRGFYSVDGDGGQGDVVRDFLIRFKESGAADVGTTNNTDPSKGWVELKNPVFGTYHRVQDRFTGNGNWFFSIADLVEFTRTGKTPANARNFLPVKAYDVRLVARDAPGQNEGLEGTDRIFADLFLGAVTEIRRVGLVLPYQAALVAEYGDGMEPDALAEVRFAGSQVVIPSSASATVDDGGLPTPRTVAFSRNPAWCCADFVTDPIVGGGRVFTWSAVDIGSLHYAATWAAETAAVREGTPETRSLVDVVIAEDGERRSLGDNIARILAGSGIYCFWRSGKWRFVVDEDADPVADPATSLDFTIVEADDCTHHGVSVEYAGADEVPTELHVEFRDAENGDARATEIVRFPDPQQEPRITERVEFPGVRRRTQVRRFGGILLRQMQWARRTFTVEGTWGRGLRLLALDPGDIVRLTSPRLGCDALLCRVMAVGWTSALQPGLELVEHVPAAYDDGFAGPNSGVVPGLRQPTDIPKPSKVTVSRVASTAGITVGGAA